MRKIFIALTVLIFTTTVAIGASKNLQGPPPARIIADASGAITDSTGSNTYVSIEGDEPSVDRYNENGYWVKSLKSSQISTEKFDTIEIAFAKDYENKQMDNCLIVVVTYKPDYQVSNRPHADVFFLNINNDAWTKLNTTPIEGGGGLIRSSIVKGKIFMNCTNTYRSESGMVIISYAQCLNNI